MTLTLLLDLDDTLLSNDINTFLPAYLKALGRHMASYVAPERMVRQLLAATQVMVANNVPGRTLEKTFDEAFYPPLGLEKEAMRPVLEDFYENIFPSLQPLTQPRPEAIRMVEAALAKGHTLVVATNPIFPRKAILHRLCWAGLPSEQVPFALITDYSRFHFAKPNPAFFAEILAQLGWPDQPAVVIGNSLPDDLLPAAQLGLPVFWVNEQPEPLPADLHSLSDQGSMASVFDWVERVESAGVRQGAQAPHSLLARLKSTPAAVDTICKDLTARQWQERPQPGEWSVTEILCHLRDVDQEVNIPRIEKLTAEVSPFIAGINTDNWASERDYLHQDGQAALSGFITARTQLIERLESLPESNWQRIARHAIFGPTTMQELVGFTTTHDRTHIQQIQAAARTLAGNAA